MQFSAKIMPHMRLAPPRSGVGVLLWEILNPPPVLVVFRTWLSEAVSWTKLDLHINFKVLSYLLYLHIYSLEIRIEMCKSYIALKFLKKFSVTWLNFT